MKRHSAILTNLMLSLPLATGLLCATATASAQTGERATIPFAFTANHVRLPAGTYEVRTQSDGVLSLCNLETGRTQNLMVRPEDEQVIETRSRLVFHHDETGNSLMQVWIAGTTVHTELMAQPKLEQASAKNGSQTGSTIEVAMK